MEDNQALDLIHIGIFCSDTIVHHLVAMLRSAQAILVDDWRIPLIRHHGVWFIYI